MPPEPIDFFPALACFPFLRHGFTTRVPGVDVCTDRQTALARLAPHHQLALQSMGIARCTFGEQIHGKELAVLKATPESPISGVDGLITATPGLALGIYVADCCAVYLVDPVRRVIALLHSGRKGTELAIASAAIARMQTEFGCEPRHMVAQLSPCIRPPDYEVDFATQILHQCRAAGIGHLYDCQISTASERYYSYRRELGQTGRMLAMLTLSET